MADDAAQEHHLAPSEEGEAEEEVEYEYEYEYEEGAEPGTPPDDDAALAPPTPAAAEEEETVELKIDDGDGAGQAAGPSLSTPSDPEYSYVGDLRDGKKHGRGRMTFKYGVYEGEWQNDMMAGYGRLELKTGNIYEGHFWRNKFDGEGKMSWACGKEYQGTMVNGQMTGKGRLTSKEGDYEGDFYNNEFFGHGVMTFSNGDRYCGEWRMGMMWGRGVFTLKAGTTYEGAFVKNKKHGRVVRFEPAKGKEYIERYEHDKCKVSNKVKKDKKSKKEKDKEKYQVTESTQGADYGNTSGDLAEYGGAGGGETLFERSTITQDQAMRELDQRALANARKRTSPGAQPRPSKPVGLTEKELAVQDYQRMVSPKKPTGGYTSPPPKAFAHGPVSPSAAGAPAPPLPTQPPPPMGHYTLFRNQGSP